MAMVALDWRWPVRLRPGAHRRERSSADDSTAACADRAPIETRSLGKNIYENICRIGDPFAVKGWELDPETRFVYFVGPFVNAAADQQTYPYLYMSIAGPKRETLQTTLHLDSLNADDLQPYAKADELQQFLLPHIAALDADPQKNERRLGKPTHIRELDSGRTRLIYDRYLCFNGKRLAGMYFDVADGEVVKAKGVDHPERMKWIVSGNVPPEADSQATYYLDWQPRNGSAQQAALALIFRLENADEAGAREYLSTIDAPPRPLDELARTFPAGVAVHSDTLTYRTTRYGLDRAEVTVAYELENGQRTRAHFQLREDGEDDWRIIDWRIETAAGP
ncbi:MAG: hypothetical protein ACREV5_17310 [Steroidobacter sp.]